MIIGFHHAQITIPQGQEEKARAFYCGVLRLKEIPKPESLAGRGGFWLEVGGLSLHVGTEDGVDRSLTKAHLAFETADLKLVEALLIEQGVEILEGLPIPGYERFEFRDPFGNRTECIQRIS
ncbi:VOC family protein [Paenibacillus nasutitermitis]|uniref:Glyoxalase n=1 Tax=Paenibacillus nasutitermitis TaxID=1652958 RepID=A0A916YYE0_9BACL|nr:VOC family protein [Paenibacillus nasutitermitis]GGD67197.1 glyoxalase [Paenibacillus nasutitermitis]